MYFLLQQVTKLLSEEKLKHKQSIKKNEKLLKELSAYKGIEQPNFSDSDSDNNSIINFDVVDGS